MNTLTQNEYLFKKYDLKQIMLDALIGTDFILTPELSDYLEDIYQITSDTPFILIGAWLGDGFHNDDTRIVEGLSAFSFHELHAKQIVIPLPLHHLILCIIYPLNLEESYHYLQQRVQNEWNFFSPESSIFLAEECKGLKELPTTINSMLSLLDWNLVLGSGILLNQKRLTELHTTPLKYPSELDGEVEKALLQKNTLTFRKCFSKLLDYSRQELHTPDEIKSICIRYAILIAHISRINNEQQTLLGMEHMMKSIVNATHWLDIWKAITEFSLPILKDCETEKAHSLLVIETRKLMLQYYNTGISLEEIADKLHVTEEYLSTIFKKETGTTFSETMRNYRINKVKQLLCTSDLKMNEIALLSGYSDGKYMSRVFREVVGMSPGEYRKARSN